MRTSHAMREAHSFRILANSRLATINRLIADRNALLAALIELVDVAQAAIDSGAYEGAYEIDRARAAISNSNLELKEPDHDPR
jgi:hypothetical protein